MARHSYEKARWKRREARRRIRIGGWWVGYRWPSHSQNDGDWKKGVTRYQIRLDRSVHGHLSETTRVYRRRWRQRAHRIGQLHARGSHDQAETLDPQPRRLGVMWDIW